MPERDPLLSTFPPDDRGSDTFARYRYQAHLTVPYCVLCGFGEDIEYVLCEHYEDIVVKQSDLWRFIQVKTRDPERGPWRLSDILRDGGGVDSLARSFRALPDLSSRYELHLEGSIARDEDIRTFAPPRNSPTPEVRSRFEDALDVEPGTLDEFLSRFVISHRPSRLNIVAKNLITLGSRADDATLSIIKDVYLRILELIEKAM